MRRILIILGLALAAATSARANQAARGWCESGAQIVLTSGLQSTTQVQASYPSCTVTIFVHGGGLATIYADNNSTPTPLSNPFTAQTGGQWQFYASNGRYDIQMSGAGFPSPVTYSDVSLSDAALGGVVFGVYTNVPFSSTPNYNATLFSIFNIVLTGNVSSSTISPATQNGQVIEINVCQDVIGNRTNVFPPSFLNTAFFTISSVANACTPTTWFYNGANWLPFSGGGNSTVVIPPSLGGTGTGTPAAHGVAVAEGPSTPFNFVLPTNNGQCLMSAPSSFGTTDPSFQTCPGSSGGTSAGSLGQINEAGAAAGSFQVSPLTDLGGVGAIVKNSADNEWCGANPFLDVRCFAFTANKTSTMVTSNGVTATCTSGLSTVTLSIASDFQNGYGVEVMHCGANNSGTTPGAPTVVASGSALGTGTRIVKPSAAPTLGSTSYTYKAVGVTKGHGYSLPSAGTTITNGAASLGTQTGTISTITASGQTATITFTAPHTMSPGYEMNIAGVTDANGNPADGFWGGNYSAVTVADTTHATYTLRQSVTNGAPTSAVGGTVTWTNVNHIGVTASGGYDYYVIYDSVANRIVCLTEPVNTNLVGDQAYLVCDDHGATLSGNFPVPDYLSATVPGSAANDSLVTTILTGGTTTSLALNAAASASTTGTIHFDNGPLYVTAANAAIAAGTSLYFPVTTGNTVWFNSSYVTWPAGTKILQAGAVIAAGTWNGTAGMSWRGADGAPCVKPQFALVCAPSFNVFPGAFPGLYASFPQLDRITFQTSMVNDQSPLALIDGLNDNQANNLNFAGSASNSEYLFTGLEIRGHHSNGNVPFSNVATNLSFTGGPAQVNSAVSTPLFYCNTCTSMVFDHVSVGRRGIVFRAPDSGGQYTIHWAYNQGGINPFIRMGFADSGSANVALNMDNWTQDTTAMPIVSSLLNAQTSVSLINGNGPSVASPGGIPPAATGSIAYLNMIAAGGRGQTNGANTTNCSSVPVWDPTFNASFNSISESVCNFSSQIDITAGYGLFVGDSNITPPTCSTATAGPPFTPAGTYTFQNAATWFNGGLGTLSPKSASCSANGSTQQITVLNPTVPLGSLGWAIFWNGNPAGNSFPSTVTTTYLFLLANGGGFPVLPTGGPAGIQNLPSKPGAVWGNFYPNAPNNTANALPSLSSTGELIATPCVPSAIGGLCYWDGAAWHLLAGNTTTTMAALTQTGTGSLSAAPIWTPTVGGGTSPVAATVTSPAQGQVLVFNNSGVLVNAYSGINVDAQTGDYTLACPTDRLGEIEFNISVAHTLTLPQAGSTACFGSSIGFVVRNTATSTAALTVFATTSTFQPENTATLPLIPGAAAFIYSDAISSTGNYHAIPIAAPPGGTNIKTASYAVTLLDKDKLIVMNCSGPCAATLPATPPSVKFTTRIVSVGSTLATVALSGTTFNGSATAPLLVTNGELSVYTDATNYFGGISVGGTAFPVTVSGTVTSGGIPCFTSTTQESSSVLMTLNAYMKGGGTGACPTPGLTTDDGTTSTYTGIGGVAVPNGPVAVGSSPPTCVGGTGNAYCGGEGTAATGLAGVDIIDFSSAQHATSVNNNNTGDMPVSRIACVNVTPVTVSANVSTDQNLMSCTLAANTLNVVGRTLKIWVAGVYTTPAASVATINLKAKLCTVSGCGSGTVINLASITSSANPGTVTNNAYNLTLYPTTQTGGASSVYEAHGLMGIDLGAVTTSADSFFNDTNTAVTSAIDSTAQLFLQISTAFSVASASNSSTERQLLVEVLN